MKRKIHSVVGAIALVLVQVVQAEAPVVYKATLDVCVLDAQSGQPMADTPVVARFPQPPTRWGALSTDDGYGQKTDAKGRCSFKGRCTVPCVSIWVQQKEYYDCQTKIELAPGACKNEIIVPDNVVVTLRVQRVVKPLELQLCDVRPRHNIFADGKDTASYDFLMGDFLPPAGTGVVADVVFTRHMKEFKGLEKIEWEDKPVKLCQNRVEVEFPGAGNGIVTVQPLAGSSLKIREAPDGAYTNRYEVWDYVDGTGHPHSSWDTDKYHCFRIRSEQLPDGTYGGGLYGKIYGGIAFDARPRCTPPSETGKPMEDPEDDPVGRMEFKYYLNKEPGDRNLEAVGEYRKPLWK